MALQSCHSSPSWGVAWPGLRACFSTLLLFSPSGAKLLTDKCHKFAWASVFFLKRESTLFQILLTQCLLLRASTQGQLKPSTLTVTFSVYLEMAAALLTEPCVLYSTSHWSWDLGNTNEQWLLSIRAAECRVLPWY